MLCRFIAFSSLLTAQSLLAFETVSADNAYTLLSFQNTAESTQTILDSQPLEEPTKTGTDCGPSLKRPMRVTMRHIEGNGVGYNQGYTTVEGFFSPIHPCDTWIPFLDLRGHVFNDGKLAANTGLGVRYIGDSRIYGVNAYYDYRKTKRQHYNQISAGLEALGRAWDFRINGYLPVGDKTSRFYHTAFDEFEGHYIFTSRKREVALKAANAEVGYHWDHYKSVPVYFAAGPYYLTGKGNTSWGGEARAVINLYEYVTLEGNTSYDSLFNWIGQGQLSINIPFGAKRKVKSRKQVSCGTALALSARAVQPVDRNEIIPVDRQRVRSKAIDPATGKPYFVWFVDNTSHSAGTFESPFPTLLAAEQASGPNDIIYIYPGDQTTTGMDAGITLKDGQRLWGSAVAHALPTTIGNIQVPVFSNGPFINNVFGTSIALLPIITSTTTAVVTIANNNEISGLYIQYPFPRTGIVGSSVSNLSVLHSTIQGESGSGTSILLSDLGGTLLFDSNTITSLAIGISMTNMTSNLNATISNNQIETSGNGFQWDLFTQGALQFTGNNLNAHSTDSFRITQESGSILTGTVSNNHMSTSDSGIIIVAGGIASTLTLQSNSIKANAFGISIGQTSGTLAATCINNQIDANGNGFDINFAGTDTGTFSFQSNAITSNANGIRLQQLVTNPLAATFTNNQIVSSSTGISVTAVSSNATLSVQSNTINSLSQIGIELTTTGSMAATITDNQIIANGRGINTIFSGTDAMVTFKSNTITSGEAGINLSHTMGSLTATASKNKILGRVGIMYSMDSTSSGSLTAVDNTIQSIDEAISISQSGDIMSAMITNNVLTSSSSATDSILLLSINTIAGLQTAILSNNTVTQGSNIGFDLTAAGTGTAIWNVNGNKFYGVTNEATVITGDGTATVCLEFNNNIAYPILVNGMGGTYEFSNSALPGTFTLNPPVGNIGVFTDYTTAGVITGTCP